VSRKRAAIAPPAAPKAAITMRRALEDLALLGGVLAGDSWLAWRVLLIFEVRSGNIRGFFMRGTATAEARPKKLRSGLTSNRTSSTASTCGPHSPRWSQTREPAPDGKTRLESSRRSEALSADAG
jgi:hypothetical protein